MSAAAAADEGAAAAASPASASTTTAAAPAADDPIVQWVVLRRDLWQELGWPLGPVIAQACHASSAAMFSTLQDAATQAYIQPSNLDHMHKVVLEVKSEAQLVNLSKKLDVEGVQHKLWVEQPENYPTCLATKPYRRSHAAAHFKKLQLCKAALAPAAATAAK